MFKVPYLVFRIPGAIEKAANLKVSDDLSVIIRLIPTYKDGEDKKAHEQLREEQKNNLKSKIEKLDAFSRLSSSLRDTIENELRNIS